MHLSGVWENTSKAVIADYFVSEKERDTAYAAVYFSSGLAGAFGYGCYQFIDRVTLATINTAIPLLALVCYHISAVSYSPVPKTVRYGPNTIGFDDGDSSGGDFMMTNLANDILSDDGTNDDSMVEIMLAADNFSDVMEPKS